MRTSERCHGEGSLSVRECEYRYQGEDLEVFAEVQIEVDGYSGKEEERLQELYSEVPPSVQF